MNPVTPYPRFVIHIKSGVDQPDQVSEQTDSIGLHKCPHARCKHAERGFERLRDLRRHLDGVHDRTAKKRACPYPGSGCKIMADEKHQLANWFDHILTVHQGYAYSCDDCGVTVTHRKGTYNHYEATGHQCMPSQWSYARREEELAEKNRRYQLARTELKLKKALGAESAWNDSWPETLPEYHNFMRKKAQKIKPSRSSYSPPVNLPLPPSLPTMHLPSRSTRRRSGRFEPYSLSRESVVPSSPVTIQMLARDNFSALLDSPSPRSANVDQPSLTHFGLADLTPTFHGTVPSASTPPSVPLSLDELRFRGPDLPLTQEEADHLFDWALFDGIEIISTAHSDEFASTPQLLSYLPPAESNSPSASHGTMSSSSDFILTPPDLPLGAFTFEGDNCLNNLTIAPRQLHFSDRDIPQTMQSEEYSS